MVLDHSLTKASFSCLCFIFHFVSHFYQARISVFSDSPQLNYNAYKAVAIHKQLIGRNNFNDNDETLDINILMMFYVHIACIYNCSFF